MGDPVNEPAGSLLGEAAGFRRSVTSLIPTDVQPEALRLKPDYCFRLAGGMMPFMRRYSTIWP